MTTTTGSKTRGIRTAYREASFRSRLESHWAAFFDLVDWSWTYEPFDTGDWIPDFAIRGEQSFLIEVGPCMDRGEYVTKATKAQTAFLHECTEDTHADCPPFIPDKLTLVLGISPIAIADDIAGYLTDDGHGSGPDWAHWAFCPQCGALGVAHESGDYRLKPCGHYNGGSYGREVGGRLLHDLWNRSGNQVQWRRR